MKIRNKLCVSTEVMRMSQAISIEELKNTSEVSELCHNTSEPVFVTKDGQVDLVVMSMETFERFFNYANPE